MREGTRIGRKPNSVVFPVYKNIGDMMLTLSVNNLEPCPGNCLCTLHSAVTIQKADSVQEAVGGVQMHSPDS